MEALVLGIALEASALRDLAVELVIADVVVLQRQLGQALRDGPSELIMGEDEVKIRSQLERTEAFGMGR